MKRFYIGLIALFIFSCQFVNGQQLYNILNGNNVSATIYDQGRLFHNPTYSSSGYELPAGSGNHLIYSTGFWFGGTNQNGDLKLAADLFGQGIEFYRGPYSSTNAYNDIAYMNNYQSGIWMVTKSEIIYHIDNYDQPGYVAPNGILNWPGNGDPSLGVSQQLAPYIDVNNNGIYEPYLGDYPCIKGDAASFQITNEDRAHNSSGGEKIGAEIHMLVYQIASNNYIDSTTFIDVIVINKGQNSFNDFRVALYMDPDIGNPNDDYIGSAPLQNLMYSYNGSNQDGLPNIPGYGINPPAMGIVSLNRTTAYSGYFKRPGLSPNPSMTRPLLPVEYWNYMNGKWKDGTPWTYGGNGYGGTSGTTKYLYDGNPYQGTGWTEIDTDGNGTSNSPGDRRLFISSDAESFLPGDTLIFNYAILVNRMGNNLENVQGLIDYADSVQHYFDTTSYSCIQHGAGTTGLTEELKNGQLDIFPNPTSHQIKIVWSGVTVNDIKILSFQEKLVKKIPAKGLKGEKIIDVSGLAPGIYFVSIGNTMRKLIVQ